MLDFWVSLWHLFCPKWLTALERFFPPLNVPEYRYPPHGIDAELCSKHSPIAENLFWQWTREMDDLVRPLIRGLMETPDSPSYRAKMQVEEKLKLILDNHSIELWPEGRRIKQQVRVIGSTESGTALMPEKGEGSDLDCGLYVSGGRRSWRKLRMTEAAFEKEKMNDRFLEEIDSKHPLTYAKYLKRYRHGHYMSRVRLSLEEAAKRGQIDIIGDVIILHNPPHYSVVQFRVRLDDGSDMKVDIVLEKGTPEVRTNSQLFGDVVKSNERVKTAFCLVKKWSKTAGICDSMNGGLNSHSVMTLFLYYLVHGEKLYTAKEIMNPPIAARETEKTSFDLFAGFLYYYRSFDLRNIVSTIDGYSTRTREDQTRDYAVIIKDPLDGHLTSRSYVGDLEAFFKSQADGLTSVFQKAKWNDYATSNHLFGFVSQTFEHNPEWFELTDEDRSTFRCRECHQFGRIVSFHDDGKDWFHETQCS